ncbi:MAG: hypothetical protein JXB08_03225 [Bacilli bacterium]|nr:hypothetical protein [Bacilli bacterium]MBN2876301.1 hypothetical protein [Bacilli bacterium]
MFDWIILLVSVSAMWVTLFLVVVLFLMRLYVVLKAKSGLNQALAVLLIPFSIGYFYAIPQETKFKKMYQTLVLVQFICGILAFIILFYTRFM